MRPQLLGLAAALLSALFAAAADPTTLPPILGSKDASGAAKTPVGQVGPNSIMPAAITDALAPPDILPEGPSAPVTGGPTRAAAPSRGDVFPQAAPVAAPVTPMPSPVPLGISTRTTPGTNAGSADIPTQLPPLSPPTAPAPRSADTPATPSPPGLLPGTMPMAGPGGGPTLSPGPAAVGCDSCGTAGMAGATDRKTHDDHLGPWDSLWVQGGYNLLWIKSAPAAPPLLATGPLGPGTQVLLGGNTYGYGGFSGLNLDGGLWLDSRHTIGLEFSGFMTEQRSMSTSVSSNAAGSPTLVRPFFNAALSAQDGLLVSSPGSYAGSVAVVTGARIDGTEGNVLFNLLNTKALTLNFLVGARYFDLEEYLSVNQVTRGLNGNTIPFFGNHTGVPGVAITDTFSTRNQFYGVQFGGQSEYRFGPLFLDLGLDLGFGPVHEITAVSGQTVVPGGSGGPGGLLSVGAIPNGNIGRTVTDRFSVLPDVHGMLGLQVTQRIRLGVGYQFMYLSNVTRPGGQIETAIDPRLVPTTLAYGLRAPSNTALGGTGTPPPTPFARDDFFVHGLNFMFEFQF